MGERDNLERAIAALEAQRDTLGADVVDDALVPLRDRLSALTVLETPPGQQRKLVTLLLADVSGFTSLSEQTDAELVSDTMNSLWERIDAVIIEHGGLVDKHIGDAVMALWGAERAREDDPEQTIRAALAMQCALATFREERGSQLTVRIGINTGPVVLGSVGTTGEFSAIGDAVNLAQRLEIAAPPNTILISHATYRHVRGIFDVIPRDPIIVKGKTEPVRTYVVERAKPRAFRTWTRGVEGIETRMVGRDGEMIALQNAFGGVVAGTGTQFVTIAGDAGIGKSRLLSEFEDWLELQSVSVLYYKGRARPDMQGISYGVIRDMLSFRFEIRETDHPATAMAKFQAGTAGVLDPDQADLVGHTIGYDFSASPAVRNLLGNQILRPAGPVISPALLPDDSRAADGDVPRFRRASTKAGRLRAGGARLRGEPGYL